MVAATEKKTPVILTDKNVAKRRDSSDGEVDPDQENASTPLTSYLATNFEHYSDEDSYLSESSEEAHACIMSTDSVGKASLGHQDRYSSSSDEENKEEVLDRDVDRISHNANVHLLWGMISREIVAPSLKESFVNPILEHKEDLRFDECDEEGNYSIHNEQERARLMKMEMALATKIPDSDSFGSSDESDSGGPRVQSSRIIEGPINYKNVSKNSNMMRIERVQDMEFDHEEQEESDISNSGSSKDRSSESSDDDNDEESFEQQQGNNNHRRKSSHISTHRDDPIDIEDNLEGGEHSASDSSNGGKQGKKKSNRKAINSSSFTEMPTFKWSNVKRKLFHSFRGLKSYGLGGDNDGSRTISVKNIAREVTEEILFQFFEDSGRIIDIKMIPRDVKGRRLFGVAYVEFESVVATRKALQKSGKSLKGRVISCDIAYESSHGGTRSTHGSSHGGTQHLRHKSVENLSRPWADPAPSLKSFEHKLQDGDTKFPSQFNEPIYASSNNLDLVDHKPDLDHAKQSKHPKPYETRARELARAQISSKEVIIVVHPHSSYCEGDSSFEFPIPPRRTGPAGEYDQSDYFDAQILEVHQPPSSLKGNKWKIKRWPWRRWKMRKPGKWTTKLLWPWRRPRWQWWHFAKLSTKWTKKGNGSHEQEKVNDLGEQPYEITTSTITKPIITVA